MYAKRFFPKCFWLIVFVVLPTLGSTMSNAGAMLPHSNGFIPVSQAQEEFPIKPQFCSQEMPENFTPFAELTEVTEIDVEPETPEDITVRVWQYTNEKANQMFHLAVSSRSNDLIDEYVSEAQVCFEAVLADEETQTEHFKALEAQVAELEAGNVSPIEVASPLDFFLQSFAKALGIDVIELYDALDNDGNLVQIREKYGDESFESSAQSAYELAIESINAAIEAEVLDESALEELENVLSRALNNEPLQDEIIPVHVEASLVDETGEPIDEPYLLFYAVDPTLAQYRIDEYGPRYLYGASARVCMRSNSVSLRLSLNGSLLSGTTATTAACGYRSSTQTGRFCAIVKGLNPGSNTYRIDGSFGTVGYDQAGPGPSVYCPG